MAKKRIHVKIEPQKGSEQAFFAKQDEKILKKLQKDAAKDADKKYRKKHEYHCFRCGTQSLAEIDEGHLKIDICVNKNCGAIHLDPGELEAIFKDRKALRAAKKAFLSVFKK